MNINKRFPIQVAVTFVAGLLIAAIPLAKIGSVDIALAVITGAVISTINVMAGFFAIEYSLDKSHNTFMKAVLGGMGIRMVVTLGLMVVLIVFAGMHMVGLAVSVLGYHAVYLVLEILYIQKKVSNTEKSFT